MYINEYLSPEAISIRRVQIDQTDGPRYASYTQYGDEGNEVSDLIKYSREIMDKGFRKNVSEYLLGTYGTLEELFFCVPGNVGFNIVISKSKQCTRKTRF